MHEFVIYSQYSDRYDDINYQKCDKIQRISFATKWNAWQVGY